MARDASMSVHMSESDPGNSFDKVGRFVLSDFQHRRPFSSFLPGIAGLQGIPMWVFYVNRGQAICSFGVENKDHPILEFQAANKAYQSTSLLGFRTFLNGTSAGITWHHEAFSSWQMEDIQHTMFIGMNEIEIQEVNPALGYQINVLYFIVPNEPFSGLVRQVSLKNLRDTSLTLEVLDGLPWIIPYGVDNGALKHIGRTIEAWMHVDNVQNRLPFYRLKATPGDTAEVSAIQSGNYALAFSDGKLLPVIADPVCIFGWDTSLSSAHLYHDHGLAGVFEKQQTEEGRSLCAFFGKAFEINPGKPKAITSFYGFASSLSEIQSNVENLRSKSYIDKKLNNARNLTKELTDVIRTESDSPVFDAYCRQTFLDNLLRGGYPLILGDKHIYHVYSRKHGDIERDYNYFVLAPEYYSQGNGNYRDINQNRRSDVFFVSQAGIANIRLFTSLIQADGYNPLVISGLTFSVHLDQQADMLRLAKHKNGLKMIFENRFTAGELLEAALKAQTSIPVEDFFHQVLACAEAHVQAEHGEGYWIDHWTYILDLIEAYLAIYPDEKKLLLSESDPLPFFDNSHFVQPRNERFVLSDGKPRQLNAVKEDLEKAALIRSRAEDKHWARAQHGQGDIFRLPLISKLTLLAILKFLTLDPSGMGIQMEAGRPGWYDALNGLPALFSSSMPETCELLRLVNFLKDNLAEWPQPIMLPVEAQVLIDVIKNVQVFDGEAFIIWDQMTSALEVYRESVRLGFDGRTVSIDVTNLLESMCIVLIRGIKKANDFDDEIPPTYFIHEITEYALTGTVDGHSRPHITVKRTQPVALPAFLEGAVHQMKVSQKEDVRHLHNNVRNSDLFDRKLGMFKVNSPLQGQSHEIGRARAFTPGWLENESIWMHMSFKYLLELLKAGLIEEFFIELKSHLPPFMEPDIYGRSPLENSSFIVSSEHPDASLHGTGFVARLSGSTAEFLNMWSIMTAGGKPFWLEKGALVLELKPTLPGWMFKQDGTFKFCFLGSCEVTLHNPSRKDTYQEGAVINRIVLRSKGETVELKGAVISSPYASRVRLGEFEAADIYY
jgi:hypothetical protein